MEQYFSYLPFLLAAVLIGIRRAVHTKKTLAAWLLVAIIITLIIGTSTVTLK